MKQAWSCQSKWLTAVEEQLVDAGFEPMDAEDLADEFDLPYLEDIVDQGCLEKW